MLPVLTISFSLFFFFNDTATTEIYTLSLHDALPIYRRRHRRRRDHDDLGHRAYPRNRRAQGAGRAAPRNHVAIPRRDRKSTRLNSSHGYISYAVFCLKKKKKEAKG